MSDIAIAHKDYDVRGGAERVAEELARTFNAPLFVGRRNPRTVDEAGDIDIREIPLTRWQRWAIDRGGALRSVAYMVAWQQVHDLADYDTVVLSGNEPVWYVPPDTQTVVAYTHSTPRLPYDRFQDHSHSLFGIGYATAVRTLYQHNVVRPDLFVANSDLVARRIKRYWGIPDNKVRVVYPPVETTQYSPDTAGTMDFYLYLGRLDKAKRVGEVIDAAAECDACRFEIAGDGPERSGLEQRAGENVAFHGYVTDDRKPTLLARAKAVIMPAANEDFGLVPIEAMASGTPVIGVNEGFTQYQIRDGSNGLLYDRGVENLCDAIREFERDGVVWDGDRIADFATRFNADFFEDGIRAAVNDAERHSAVAVPWEDA